MGKIEMRIVRETNNQVVVNIPAIVRETLELKGGDIVAFTPLSEKVVAITKVEEKNIIDFVAKELK